MFRIPNIIMESFAHIDLPALKTKRFEFVDLEKGLAQQQQGQQPPTPTLAFGSPLKRIVVIERNPPPGAPTKVYRGKCNSNSNRVVESPTRSRKC